MDGRSPPGRVRVVNFAQEQLNVLVFPAHHMAYQVEIPAHGDRAIEMIVVEETWVGQKRVVD